MLRISFSLAALSRPILTGSTLLILFLASCRPAPTPTAGESKEEGQPAVEGTRAQAEPAPWRRPSHEPSPGLLASAQRHLEASKRPLHSGRCGSFGLLTTVSDEALLEACDRLATELHRIYAARFGVRPVGANQETIFLFADTVTFRAFATTEGRLAPGYAGYADPPRGYLALPTDRERQELLRTLAHELTHLVHRRAFGRDLPPWLSEGLADAIGDTASEEGYSPLSGFAGIEGPAQRLRSAYSAALAPSLSDLLGRDRTTFDRVSPSFDYAASALWTRFLLLDPELGQDFRRWLETWADRNGPEPRPLVQSLGISEEDLELRFRRWLG